jgi:tetratricopeptide (TPR) repeat protein
MDSKIWIPVAMIVALLGWVWIQNDYSLESNAKKTITPKLEASKKLSNELLEAARDEVKKTSVIKISDECKKVWDELQALKGDDFKLMKFPNLAVCQHVPPQFAPAMMNYMNACKNAIAGALNMTEKDKNDCRSAVYTYRATITDFYTRDQDIDQIGDLKILIDKLIASFGAGADLDTDRMLQAAERIHQLAPELFEPVKAMVVARFGPIFKGEKDPVRLADAFAAIEKAVQTAEEFNTADPDLWEAKFLARTRLLQDLDRGDQVINEMRQVKGLEGMSDYFQAGIEWRRGDTERAAALLERAIQRDPKNERYLESREKMQGAKAGDKNIFQAGIRFTFDFDADQYKN